MTNPTDKLLETAKAKKPAAQPEKLVQVRKETALASVPEKSLQIWERAGWKRVDAKTE